MKSHHQRHAHASGSTKSPCSHAWFLHPTGPIMVQNIATYGNTTRLDPMHRPKLRYSPTRSSFPHQELPRHRTMGLPYYPRRAGTSDNVTLSSTEVCGVKQDFPPARCSHHVLSRRWHFPPIPKTLLVLTLRRPLLHLASRLIGRGFNRRMAFPPTANPRQARPDTAKAIPPPPTSTETPHRGWKPHRQSLPPSPLLRMTPSEVTRPALPQDPARRAASPSIQSLQLRATCPRVDARRSSSCG